MAVRDLAADPALPCNEASSGQTGARFVRRACFVDRLIGGSWYLVDVTDRYEGGGFRLVRLNDTGHFVWQALSVPRSVVELAELLSDAVGGEVPLEQIEADVRDLVADLRSNTVVEPC